MAVAYIALLLRILLLGTERIIVKKLGSGSDSIGATFLFFSIALIFLLPALFFVEWPENIAPILPARRTEIHLNQQGPEKRKLCLSNLPL